MRIGIFSDPHYSSQKITCGKRYNSRSLEKIQKAYGHFEDEGCDLVVCLGDLIDKESSVDIELENLRKISAIMKSCPSPTVCLMGNHDAFALSAEQFYTTLGIEPPSDMYIDGKALIFLDACFFSDGASYAPGDTDWTDAFLPNEDGLKEKLCRIDGNSYLFIHQNIDPSISEDHRISNSGSVLEIINQSHTVKAVFQGHYHPGARSSHDGVEYIALPAMCENEAAFFIYDI